MNLYRRRNLSGLVFVLPVVVFFLIFRYYPILRAAELSFQDWNLLMPPVDVGWENYQWILENERVHKIMLNTIEFVAWYAGPNLIIGLALALIFVQPFRGRGFYRTLYFVPIVLSEALIAVVWRLLFNQRGLVNAMLDPVTTGPVPWLTNGDYAQLAVIIVAVWRTFGYYMLIFIAGLNQIPRDYYDAAKVDGANSVQLFWGITFPLLRPTTVFVLVTTVITATQSFSTQYVLTRGSPNDATNVLGLLVWQEGFASRNLGRAAALSMTLFVVLLVLSAIQLIALRSRRTDTEVTIEA
jgi:ABC-type sugar transport system permease subunit